MCVRDCVCRIPYPIFYIPYPVVGIPHAPRIQASRSPDALYPGFSAAGRAASAAVRRPSGRHRPRRDADRDPHRPAAARRSCTTGRTSPPDARRRPAHRRCPHAVSRRPGSPSAWSPRARRAPEVVRGTARHRATGLAVLSSVRLQGAGQPRPAHLGQQRVRGHLGVQFGTHQRDETEGALPGLGPGRIVEQHQPPVGQVLAVHHHRRLQGVGVRREALGRRGRVDLDLVPYASAQQRVNRVLEGERGAVPVREVPMSRCHAGKTRRNRALTGGRHPGGRVARLAHAKICP